MTFCLWLFQFKVPPAQFVRCLCICVNVSMWVYLAWVLVCIRGHSCLWEHVGTKRAEKDVWRPTLALYTLYPCWTLSLKLQLGWQPKNPSNPPLLMPLSIPHSTGVTGAQPSLFFFLWTFVLKNIVPHSFAPSAFTHGATSLTPRMSSFLTFCLLSPCNETARMLLHSCLLGLMVFLAHAMDMQFCMLRSVWKSLLMGRKIMTRRKSLLGTFYGQQLIKDVKWEIIMNGWLHSNAAKC